MVASQPLSVDELDARPRSTPNRVQDALELLAERYAEGRSGIVLEQVAGGFAFRAAAEASEACARLFEKPVEKGLSQAALETLAIVAYLGPVTRPEIARIRGVNVDGVIAGLVERGLSAKAAARTSSAPSATARRHCSSACSGSSRSPRCRASTTSATDVAQDAPRSGRSKRPSATARSARRSLGGDTDAAQAV